MPWLSGKALRLFGTDYERGTVIPQVVVDRIPPGRLGSLERLRMLQQITPGQAEKITQSVAAVAVMDSEAGEVCPHCGSGPFKRLAQHVSQMHEGV
jgi:hypothetical protein